MCVCACVYVCVHVCVCDDGHTGERSKRSAFFEANDVERVIPKIRKKWNLLDAVERPVVEAEGLDQQLQVRNEDAVRLHRCPGQAL